MCILEGLPHIKERHLVQNVFVMQDNITRERLLTFFALQAYLTDIRDLQTVWIISPRSGVKSGWRKAITFGQLMKTKKYEMAVLMIILRCIDFGLK